MGVMNLLKANWSGKVGQTVGAKWKNKSTIRTFTKPAYTNTPAQMTIRQGFGEIASFVALFAEQIKSLSSLDTKGMSVRNAIIKLNKDQVVAGQIDYATLRVSRGGLPPPSGFTVTAPAGLASFNVTWVPSVGATISNKAKVVCIIANDTNNFAVVGSALNSAATMSIPTTVPAATQFQVYLYLIDYRGSTRVGSVSQHNTVTSPAS